MLDLFYSFKLQVLIDIHLDDTRFSVSLNLVYLLILVFSFAVGRKWEDAAADLGSLIRGSKESFVNFR